MQHLPRYSARSDATKRSDTPGEGDDIACFKCGKATLDTGLECDTCGTDNYEAVYGHPFGMKKAQEQK